MFEWMPDFTKCPATVKTSLERYETGVPTGGFLRAVLTNDLTEAIGRADHINGPAIPHIVAYCYEFLPHESWGSAQKVDSWLEAKRAQRELEGGER